MKHEKILSFLWSVVLSFLLAYGAAGALATGFGLKYGFEVPLVLCLAAIIFSACFVYFGGAALALSLLALGCGYVWRTGDLVLQSQALLRRISSGYNSAYGWGTLSWPDVDLKGVTTEVPLIIIGAVIALCVCWTLCRRKPAWLAVGLALLPFAACVVVTDTVPSSGMLFLYFLGMILLLITQSIRREDSDAGNRLLALLAIPVTLALALLFWLVPRDTYEPLDEATGDRILSWFDSFQEVDLEEDVSEWFAETFTGIRVEKVNLATVGSRRDYRYPVMTVIAPKTGALYLRGNAYDIYNGTSWSASEGTWMLAYDFWKGEKYVGTVEIETRGTHDVLYFPYSPDGGPVREERAGSYLNVEKWTSYSFSQYRTDGYREYLQSLNSRETVNASAMSKYLRLPEETRQRAKAYLRINLGDKLGEYPQYQVLEIAEKIADLVSGTAPYSLNTARMPTGETDFAMWFLEEGTTGYCVHYATAATVLLRAAGIPARYVTGYLVDAKGNEEVEVLGGDAHAWVEYWHPDLGWMMLEVTPGSGTGEVEDDTTALTETDASVPDDETETTAPSTQQTQTGVPGTSENPNTGKEPEQPVEKAKFVWTPAMTYIALIIGIPGAVIAQWRLRVRYRRRRMRMGSFTEQGLYRWRILELQTALLGVPTAEEAYLVAAKAKFSQHKLTKEDLDRLDMWLDITERQLREQGAIRRIINCLVFAVY